MCRLPLGWVLARALGGALLLAAIQPAPALAAGETLAALLATTCLPAIDDLSTVDSLAKRRHWTPLSGRSGPAAQGRFQQKSVWRATEDGETFIVLTGTGTNSAGLSGNLCMVMLPPRQDVTHSAFFAAISKLLELRTLRDVNTPQGRMIIYEVQNSRPKRVALQVISKPDGSLVQASMVAMK
jgi:hypothetical protein